MMSDENDINRRKALKATGGVGAALIGIPSTVAGDSDSISKWSEEEKERKKREIKKELDQTPFAVGDKSTNVDDFNDDSELNIHRSDIPEDVNLFIGKYRNAEVPSGDPYAIEEKDEWLDREAPPGFDSPDVKYHSTSVPDLYVQEDLGSIGFRDYTVEVGIGFGIKFATKAVFGAKASVTVDFFIGGVTITPLEYSVQIGISEEGLCVKELKFTPPKIPGKMTAAGCFDFGIQLQNGEISVFADGSLDLCANPCSPFSCSICKGVSIGVDYNG